MKDFVAYLVKNLVDQPDEVNVDIFDGDRSLKMLEVILGNPFGRIF